MDRRDTPFGDPTSLLISPDHYVTRLLHANGIPLQSLGAGGMPLTAVEMDRVRKGAPWQQATYC